MEPLLTGVAGTVISEGVKFLYRQAAEILSSWRARRQDASAAPPQALPPPPGVSVGPAKPLPDAPAGDALETLQEWKELAEPIKNGTIDVDDPAARQVIAKLRAVVEAALQAPTILRNGPEHRPTGRPTRRHLYGTVRAGMGDRFDTTAKPKSTMLGMRSATRRLTISRDPDKP
jgi:hypothetical protein